MMNDDDDDEGICAPVRILTDDLSPAFRSARLQIPHFHRDWIPFLPEIIFSNTNSHTQNLPRHHFPLNARRFGKRIVDGHRKKNPKWIDKTLHSQANTKRTSTHSLSPWVRRRSSSGRPLLPGAAAAVRAQVTRKIYKVHRVFFALRPDESSRPTAFSADGSYVAGSRH